MEQLPPSLPPEMLLKIISYIEQEETPTAPVSKEWQELTDTALKYLLDAYASNPLLEKYVIEALEPKKGEEQSNLFKIRQVFRHIQEEALQSEINVKHMPSTLSIQGLEEIANKINRAEESFSIFFSNAIAGNSPSAYAFLNNELSTLEEGNKSQAIKKWVRENEGVLIRELEAVSWLSLSNLELEVLPSWIKYFTRLEDLNLENNNLTILPPEIGSLTRLQVLSLMNNQLRDLPLSFSSLTQLRELSLTSNDFTTFPLEICSLTQLRNLYFRSNELTNIPPEISFLTQLRELTLDRNKLTTLPPELSSLNFYRLEVTNNPLQWETISSEIRHKLRM